ncbi:MAG: hypothetical protein HY828_18370 [Actinobacteria bacterium]|nr:hypothetical protein [Actinomycetota bacterium]
MAVTTQDTLIAAMTGAQRKVWVKANVTAVAGRMCSLWSGAGQPGVGSTTLGQAAAGVVPVDTDTGFQTFTNPGSGSTYIAGISGVSAASGVIVVWDNLWTWGSGGSGWSVTTTTAQNTTTPAALTRPDSTGEGTEAWLEVLATMGAGAATPVLSYTNQAGTAGRTTGTMGYNSAAIIGSMYNFPLTAAGDWGVRSVQSLTLSVSMTSGTARVMILRRLATIPVVANVGFKYNAYDLGLPVVSNDAALMIGVQASSTASGPTQLEMILAQG